MPFHFFIAFRGFLSAAIMGILMLTVLPQGATAQQQPDRQAIESIIREYLLANPQLLVEMQEVLETRQKDLVAAKQKKALEENRDAIFASANDIIFGDPDAKITVVEFFDYNCGFCQRAMADMTRLLETNKDIRFVLKEFPVLGEPSVNAHKASLAFAKQLPEKLPAFHMELLGLEGRKDGERAVQLAVAMGANEARLREDMEKPGIVDIIRETYNIADDLGISGTPSYVIGNEVVFGAVGYDQLASIIASIPTD